MAPNFTSGALSLIRSRADDVDMAADIDNETNPFGVSVEDLESMFQPRSLSTLNALGGLDGLEKDLKTNLQAGLYRDDDFLTERSGYGTISRNGTFNENIKGRKHQSRIAVYGENRIPEKHGKSLGLLFLMAFDDKVLQLLTGAAFISLALGLYQTFTEPHGPGRPRIEWIEGVSILAAVIIAVSVSALNDWQKERQFIKLNKKVGQDYKRCSKLILK
jgi:P-type Ca2+ transporter type 2C